MDAETSWEVNASKFLYPPSRLFPEYVCVCVGKALRAQIRLVGCEGCVGDHFNDPPFAKRRQSIPDVPASSHFQVPKTEDAAK